MLYNNNKIKIEPVNHIYNIILNFDIDIDIGILVLGDIYCTSLLSTSTSNVTASSGVSIARRSTIQYKYSSFVICNAILNTITHFCCNQLRRAALLLNYYRKYVYEVINPHEYFLKMNDFFYIITIQQIASSGGRTCVCVCVRVYMHIREMRGRGQKHPPRTHIFEHQHHNHRMNKATHNNALLPHTHHHAPHCWLVHNSPDYPHFTFTVKHGVNNAPAPPSRPNDGTHPS